MNLINPLVILSLFCLTFFWGFGLAPVSPFAQNYTSQPKPKDHYPQKIVKAYLNGCSQRSVQEGLTQQQAEIVCQCTINRFQSQYSFDQFLKLYTQAQKTKESPDEFVDVGIDCATQLLK